MFLGGVFKCYLGDFRCDFPGKPHVYVSFWLLILKTFEGRSEPFTRFVKALKRFLTSVLKATLLKDH